MRRLISVTRVCGNDMSCVYDCEPMQMENQKRIIELHNMSLPTNNM